MVARMNTVITRHIVTTVVRFAAPFDVTRNSGAAKNEIVRITPPPRPANSRRWISVAFATTPSREDGSALSISDSASHTIITGISISVVPASVNHAGEELFDDRT